MPVTGIAVATPALRSRFLVGLAPRDLQIVLAAGNELHFRANSVVVHQRDPAEHMFVLTNGRARHFYMTEQGIGPRQARHLVAQRSCRNLPHISSAQKPLKIVAFYHGIETHFGDLLRGIQFS